MQRFVLSLIGVFLIVGLTFGGGFEIYEFGAASSAMSGATVARAWDASTIFYNPSGMAFLKGSNFYGNLTLIFPENKFTGAEPTFTGEEHSAKSQVFTPIGLYFSQQIGDRFAAGIGVTNPFGLGLEWEEDFVGRGIARRTDLKSFYISPVVSYRVLDQLSISAGLDLVYSTVELERSVYMFDSEGSAGYEVGESKLTGTSDLGIGFTVSTMFRTEKLGLGFLYRHSVENKFNDGEAEFTVYDTYAKNMASGLLVDQKGSTEIPYPNFFSVGVYYKVLESLGLEVDYLWYNWSMFDELVLDFPDDRLDQTVPENYENSIQFRVGLHYDLSPSLQLRAGYIYDQTPQPVESVSPLLPDNDRHDYSFGLGYKMGSMQFDVGYMLVDFGERSTVENGVGQNEYGLDGTYAAVAHLVFLSYGINF